MEAVICREGEKPAGAVQVGDRGAGDPLKDASGKALHVEHVHVLQPHQGPCCSLKVLEGWQVLLHLLEAILQSCKGRENKPPFKKQVVSISYMQGTITCSHISRIKIIFDLLFFSVASTIPGTERC